MINIIIKYDHSHFKVLNSLRELVSCVSLCLINVCKCDVHTVSVFVPSGFAKPEKHFY